MGSNTFGQVFKFTTFGESHGVGLGVVVDGCPSGVSFDLNFLNSELERRRPGIHAGSASQVANQIVSTRKENDLPQVLSGVFDGMTLGTPIAVTVLNKDHKSEDYDQIKTQSRAGHADDVWVKKFGHSDHRGGGRSSGRETLSRVIAGSIAKMLIKKIQPDLRIITYATQIGPFELSREEKEFFLKGASQEINFVDTFGARFPSSRSDKVIELLKKAQQEGESYGGTIEVCIQSVPIGLGEPVFHKLKADLAHALMSIGATTGFEIGLGSALAKAKGTDLHRDSLVGGEKLSESQKYGGIRGGISTGDDILLRLFIKPTSSILDLAKHGRHDPCIVPRAIPVVEAMVACVFADHLLMQKLNRV